MIYVNGDPDYQPIFDDQNVYSRHMTFIFNTFVMFQVFNFLNARKINDEVQNNLFRLMFSLISPTILYFWLLSQ